MPYKDPAVAKIKRQEWYTRTIESRREYANKYRAKYRDRLVKMQRGYREKNLREINDKRNEWRARVRVETFGAYGGKCNCCGESRIEFLTIDHINNDGKSHRTKIKSQAGFHFYLWLRRNNYPEGFQTLCWNCNCAKQFYGICPHKKEPTL